MPPRHSTETPFRSRGAALTRPLAVAGAALILVAILIGAGSLLISYDALRDRLIQTYGADRTSRYLSKEIFLSIIGRTRLATALLLALGFFVYRFRISLARILWPSVNAVALSIVHLRRWKLKLKPVIAVTVIVLTLIGLFVRWQFIHQPMRDDESTTMMLYASKPFYFGLSVYIAPNNHIFHTLLVHMATVVGGAADWVIRLPALLAGLLLIPLTYALFRRFTTQTAALWTAALVSSSSILVEYSTNARGYTMLCCETAVLLISAKEVLKVASPRWFILFGTACVLGCWTVPIFLIPMGATVLWMGWEGVRRSRRFRLVFFKRLLITCSLAGAATVLVYLPPMFVSGFNSVFRNEWIAPHDFRSFLFDNSLRSQRTWASWHRDLPWWWGPLLAILFLTSFALYPRLRVLTIAILLWTLFLFIARRFVPFERTWLLFLPVFLGIAASAPAWLFERVIPPRARLPIAMGTSFLLAVVLAFPIVRNRSILVSGEPGVLRSASSIVDYMGAQSISPVEVFRNRDYDFPLQYYYWRRHGTEAPQANPKSLTTEGWMLVNRDIGESFQADVRKFGLQDVRVLEEHPFTGSSLYRISWTGIERNSPNGS